MNTRLLKIEWLKIKNYKMFYWMLILVVGLHILINIIAKTLVNQVKGSGISMITESYSFPGVWKTVAYSYSWAILFAAVIVIVNISNEFTFKTIRQNIIDGLSRKEFLYAKFYLMTLLALIFTACYTILCIVFAISNGVQGFFENSHYILFVFIHTLTIFSIAFVFTLFIKRSGFTIILFFAYLMIESTIAPYININLDYPFGNLLPMRSVSELLPSSSLEKVKEFINMKKGSFSPIIYAGACMFYCVVSFFIAKVKLEKSDL